MMETLLESQVKGDEMRLLSGFLIEELREKREERPLRSAEEGGRSNNIILKMTY